MSLSSILVTSSTALRAVQDQLQWRTDNISNAQNADYSRRDSVTSSTSAHSVTTTIQRAVADDVRTEMLNSNGQAAYSTQALSYSKQLGDTLGTTSSTPYIQDAMDKFAANWQSFEVDPSNITTESQLVGSGQRLAQTISQAAQGLLPLRTQAINDGNVAITALNKDLKELETVNNDISAQPDPVNNTPDLLDKRDALVKSISSAVGVKVISHADGSVALYTQNGSALVDHSSVQFAWNSVVNGQPWVSMVGSVGVSPGLNAGFAGGKIGAILDFLDVNTASPNPNVAPLAKLQAQLDGVASQLAGQAPNTFGGAYYAAAADRTTDLPGGTAPAPVAPAPMQSFFTIDNTGPPPAQSASQSLSLNANLVSGAATIKRQAATPVVAALTSATRALNAGGINVNSLTYSQLVTSISNYQTSSQSSVSDSNTRLTQSSQTYATRYNSVTGVNMDSEMAQMTALQNAYSANARVINTVEAMFDVLMGLGK